MNISVRRLEANDGSGIEERPDYVAEALEAPREVGYRDGKPLVPHPEGADDGLELGDDPTEAYSHYVRGDSLLLPDSGDFLRRLCDVPEVGGLDDVAEELNTDRETVEKAAELHGVSTPLVPHPEGADDGAEGDGLELPSGETVGFDPLHPLVLSQLLSDGLGVEESARYLSAQAEEHYTPSDVRNAAQQYDLLKGGSDGDTSLVPDRERTVTAGGGEPASTPW